MADLSYEQLDKLVNGAPIEPLATFFDNVMLDVAASNAQGKRVYRESVYIKAKHPQQVDFITRQATKQDFDRFPDEYQKYLDAKENPQHLGIECLAMLTPIQKRSLMDQQITTLEQFISRAPAEYDALKPIAKSILEAQHGTLPSGPADGHQQQKEARPARSRQAEEANHRPQSINRQKESREEVGLTLSNNWSAEVIIQ